jgi:hypothetical protein
MAISQLTCYRRRRHSPTRPDQTTILRVAQTTNVVTIGTSTMYIYCTNHDHHTHSFKDILRNSQYQSNERPCEKRVTPCGPQRDGLKQWCVRSEALLWQSTQVDTPTSDLRVMPKEPRGGLTKTRGFLLEGGWDVINSVNHSRDMRSTEVFFMRNKMVNWYRDPKALYRDFLHAFVPWRLPCLFGTGDFFSFGEMSQMVASGKGLHGRI